MENFEKIKEFFLNKGFDIDREMTWTEFLSIRDSLITNQEQKVKYLNSLRSIVSVHCPVNKMGAALVTDYDLLNASILEHFGAIQRAII